MPRESLLVRGVHFRKVIHARQEDVDLHHLAEVRAGGLENGREIGDAECGHLGDGRAGEREDGSGWCAGDLAG